MAEQVDASDLKSDDCSGRAGSIPAWGTRFVEELAQMAELVDASDSKLDAERREGSSPSLGTKF